ncbi:prion-like-(Q/N-rich) domain-bearing protein 25 [Aethina tumida]|uniref:prion-like-(Q/N-rich) domain-bearing protein 25 n=1 Tax=Aethina tumida TaxID=116153 RepID=UPI0021486642|nr:prion-like-(Q/N-rich) domain-bearing protein 25 [Aethina tumida]
MVLFKILMSLIVFKHAMCLNNLILTKQQSLELTLIPCKNNEDCRDVGGVCVNEFCKCGDQPFCSEQTTILVNKIGESCTDNRECNVEHSQCTEGKCECMKDMVPTPNQKTCLKMSTGLGGECEDSVQCSAKTPSSHCQENKCVCQQHMHGHNGSCYKTVDLGQRCAETNECIKTEHSRCVEAKCTCEEEYVAGAAKCLIKAKGIDSPCSEDVQCVITLGSGSQCFNGYCRCKELFQVKNSTGKCVQDMLLGDKCETNADCHQPGSGESRLECILGDCKCKSDYQQFDGYCLSSSVALKPTSVLLGLFMLFLFF